MAKQTKKYRAILTGNQRDVHLMDPKVLLQSITYEDGTEFRDHTWVSQQYFPKLPRGHSKKTYTVTFTAKEREYHSLTGIKKKLVGLRNVEYM